jgi:parallel beta-helix repeat protein
MGNVMERNQISRKGLTFGIILLFIGTSIIPSTAQNIWKPSLLTSRGNWLYVGGSGPGNYSRIQDAIDNAIDGDTVFVYSGTYYENLVVTKSISVIGEDKNITVIDGMGAKDKNCVTITDTSKVNLMGFTFQNATYPNTYGVEIEDANEITIIDNIFNYDYFGLWIFGDNNIISNNKFSNITYSCVIIIKANYNLFSYNNIIKSNGGGIEVWTHSEYNIISHNHISTPYTCIIFYGHDCNSNRINNNTMSDSLAGIGLLENSERNMISYNNFIKIKKVVRFYGCNINTFDSNYWGRPLTHPKIIFGIRLIYLFTIKSHSYYFPDHNIYLPILKTYIDKNPAKEPYDI